MNINDLRKMAAEGRATIVLEVPINVGLGITVIGGTTEPLLPLLDQIEQLTKERDEALAQVSAAFNRGQMAMRKLAVEFLLEDAEDGRDGVLPLVAYAYGIGTIPPPKDGDIIRCGHVGGGSSCGKVAHLWIAGEPYCAWHTVFRTTDVKTEHVSEIRQPFMD